MEKDTGWAWLVLFASFILQTLSAGTTYNFGLYLVALLQEFEKGESITSFIGSLQPCLMYMTGLFGAPLNTRFGWQAVTVFGSCLCSGGFLISSYSNSIVLLYLSYGILTGAGNGLMYLNSNIVIQYYFERKRSLATGLASCGSSAGNFIFGYTSQYLISTTGWRNALKTQAVVVSLGVLCGLAFRPVHEKSQEAGATSNTEIGLLTNNECVDSECDRILPDNTLSEKVTSNTLDFSLFKRVEFILFSLCYLTISMTYYVTIAYIPEKALKLGITPTQAGSLISVMAISGICVRFIVGPFADRSEIFRFYLGGSLAIILACISVLISFFNGYVLLVVYCSIVGACLGAWYALMPVILVDMFGLEYIAKSVGQTYTVAAPAYLISAPFCGFIIQKTGNLDTPFHIIGVLQTVGAIGYFCIKLCKKSTTNPYERV